MISVAQQGALCSAIYGTPDASLFDHIYTTDQITSGYALINGVSTFTFAGSETEFDWIRDFLPIPYSHPQLGTLHQGFWDGMDGAWLTLFPLIGTKLAIQGHSLGGAHAAIFAGLCGIHGYKIDRLTLFAPPRPGYSTLRNIVQSYCSDIKAFQNGIDPVPDLPIPLPSQPWVHVADLTKINVPPSGVDDVIPTKWHNLELYRMGTSNF